MRLPFRFVPLALLLPVLFVLSRCAQVDDDGRSSVDAQAGLDARGIAVLKNNCLSCHSPEANPKTRIAPSLPAMKARYWTEYSKEEAFVEQMTAFLMKPEADAALMPEAVEQFGIMPKLGMSTSDYEAVAALMFRESMEDPNWFAALNQGLMEGAGNATAGEATDYLQHGKDLALATKAVLGKNLLSAIQARGTAGALGFCNERAIVLTDSMALALGAEIRRVSDQNRNTDNAANADELAYIALAKAEIEAKGQVSPQLQEIDGQMVGYYPIMTNGMCLQCHGQPGKEVQEPTLARLASLYPDDRATGYGPDQLRGIWVVAMGKDQASP